MIVRAGSIAPASTRGGVYEFWCGGDLRSEVRALLSLLKAFGSGIGMRVVLHPQEVKGVAWLGDLATYCPSIIEGVSVAELVIYTSGTTGASKPVVRGDFAKELEQKKGRGEANDIWALTYNPYRWAGITLLCHVIKHGCAVVVPKSLDLSDILAVAGEATHISLTPSLFRKILIQFSEADLRQLKLRQVTFGGEAASQSILDEARRLFPGAKITHTYASTEFGDICSSSDGLVGFHESKFRRFSFSEEGELIIGGKPTGDLWKKEGSRCHFVARVTDVVNVGGNKISLHAVEEAAMKVIGVWQASARAVPNPLLGHVITLDYVGDRTPRELMVELRQILPKHACPSSLNQLAEIAMTEAGKTKR